MLPVVGLGGSAGSIPALQHFFFAMPADSGMAFVVILHLSPEHVSILDNILGSSTSMSVVQAQDGLKIEANTVYVIPPGKLLQTSGERLKLVPMEQERGKLVAVDYFFRSLADTHGPKATAIVLSGADGDGALGLKRVKERGGLTISQEPTEAEHTGMPQTAINTGMVDWVLPVHEMPARLLAYRKNASLLRLPSEDELTPAMSSPEVADSDEAAFRDILAFLRIRTARDYSCYKRATIVRRIARRMQVTGATTMAEYLGFLRLQPGETGALQRDLLISVTNFFRDREAFVALEERIPDLFAGKTSVDSVRVWTIACATGEEAFSIGMMLLEYAATLDSPPAIQIFATDLADDVIVTAREAVYPQTIVADVSEERLRRFFTKEKRGYRIRRELRECVLFAAHDVLKDTPFSRMDLISCRNLLIYLSPGAQKRALETMHFALRFDGLLFLGASESVDEESSLWTIVDKKQRLFRQNSSSKPNLPVPLGPETLSRAVAAQERGSENPSVHGAAFALQATLAVQRSLPSQASQFSWEELHFKLIERFSPPSIIVTRDYDIVHVSQSAGRLLHFSVGEPSLNLLRVVNPMLRIELRAALFRAAQINSPVEVFNVPVELDGRTNAVDIRVCPAQEVAPDYLLVVLALNEGSDVDIRPAQSNEPAIHQLERENELLKRRLRDVIEQYEASGEELKAGNEELQAMNEELRSSAEELETSREELQSINEELTTVNHELKSKVDELATANSDFVNLMAATGVAIIFLDRRLGITRFTPKALTLFNLIEGDVGRPLSDITHRLNYPELKADAETVLSTLVPRTREVSEGQNWYLAQALPYRTSEDQILGVVLSFIDITGSRAAQKALQASEERLKLILENAREFAIISLDLDRRVTTWNVGAQRLLGYTESEILCRSADVIFTPEDRAAKGPEQETDTAVRNGGASDERWHVRKDGTRFWGSGSMMSMHDAEGQVIGFVKIFSDQTVKHAAEQSLRQSRSELLHAIKENEEARRIAEAATRAKDQFLAVVSHELRTPLTPVTIGLKLIQRTENLPQMAHEAIEMINRNVQFEMRLIDDLLDVSRIVHGKLQIKMEPVDLHVILRNVLSIVSADLEAKHQQVQSQLEATNVRVYGDSERLQQVFWNLLKNASKFTPDRGSVYIASDNRGSQLVVEIRDSGIGFSSGSGESLFNPFSQAGQSAMEHAGGLGLGLAIAKAVVDAHHGTIEASSPGLGSGATFTVSLPVS
jgi:two-component system CheB/CheR fusion protein